MIKSRKAGIFTDTGPFKKLSGLFLVPFNHPKEMPGSTQSN